MDSPARRVPFVGLTGGLGAGKSEALRALNALGAATLSTDEVAHDLLAGELHDEVVERLGPDVAPGRRPSTGRWWRVPCSATTRRARGSRDCSGPGWEPGSRSGGRAWPIADPAPRAAVVEVPLLFESGMEAAFDATIAVVADEAERERRAGARGHASVAEREARQLSQAEKAQRADYTVRNDGTLQELREELSHVLARLDQDP